MLLRDPTRADLRAHRPFPGLRPYGFADHEYFFGREEQAFALYRLLDRSHFVAVVGSSGSGKSSLVRAGLLPLLHQESSDHGTRSWRWLTLRPGNQPRARLASALAGAEPESTDDADRVIHSIRRETIEVLLRHSSLGLREAVRELKEAPDRSILIIVDQFEEIFRYAEMADGGHDDPVGRETRAAEAAAFVQLLLEASRDPSRKIHVMITMRSDYLGDCARFHGLPEAVAANQFLVPSLTRDEREAAIRGPIEQAGASIESALVQRLLNESSAGNDQLPVLQHALMRTWDAAERQLADGRRGSRQLTDALYEEIGTLGSALSWHADAIMAQLPDMDLAVEQTFRALAELDRDHRPIRRPRSFANLYAETGVPQEDLRRVLDRFRRDDCSFIVPGLAEPLADETIVDIGHEALIRRWNRIGGNPATGDGGTKGWLWAEADDGNIYRGLLALAEGSAAKLPSDQVESRWRWWTSRPRTDAWAARYGGGLERVQRLFENSRRALEEERVRQAREERHRRLLTRTAVTAAVVASVLAVVAVIGFLQAYRAAEEARQAAVEAKAGAFWYGLQLWGGDLQPGDVTALWDLSQQDDEVHVAFVRQLVEDRVLLPRFGLKPQPIARAIGLRWPDQAREIVKSSLARVASDEFNPGQGFELMAYTRTLGALRPWLEEDTAESATRNIAGAIDRLALEPRLDDREIWTLAEAVKVFDDRLGQPDLVEPARERLRAVLGMAATGGTAWRDGTISRAIEALAPKLSAEERLQAISYLVPRLGQERSGWAAGAVPRALVTLLPKLEAGRAPEILQEEVPAAIARSAGADPGESSDLLALMQVAETLGEMEDPAAVAAFGQALTATLAQPHDPYQRAALARAAMPYLARSGGNPPALLSSIAGILLVPESGDLDPRARSLFRQNTLPGAEAALGRALPGDPSKEREAAEALDLLLRDWAAAPSPNARPNAYRRAGQVRLLAVLAPLLTDALPSQAAAALLAMLPQTRDNVTREAVAGALAALAPTLPERERAEPLRAAKGALATTGAIEEATAWAHAVAALAPEDAAAATAEMVEALKYPTATDEATEVLLEALAARWDDGSKFEGRTLPDPELLDWLEERTPGDDTLASPPIPPSELERLKAAAGRM